MTVDAMPNRLLAMVRFMAPVLQSPTPFWSSGWKPIHTKQNENISTGYLCDRSNTIIDWQSKARIAAASPRQKATSTPSPSWSRAK